VVLDGRELSQNESKSYNGVRHRCSGNMKKENWKEYWLKIFPEASTGTINNVEYVQLHGDYYYNLDDLIRWVKKNHISFDNVLDELYKNFPNITPEDTKDVLKAFCGRKFITDQPRKLVEEWTSLDDAEQLRREVRKWVEEALKIDRE